ncbi:hypothetical protein SDC9_125951 [bioreactor metagenome]|uniref:IrrE N-terminal-like domain-containing protein n=1 Tax=bioreactor metagenome TaxID=1076179 RepID=A0A645CPE8_9ZZZZ
MQKLFDIYEQLHNEGVKFFNWYLNETQSATIEMKGAYAVFIDTAKIDTAAQENAIVAHEAGHIFTGTTHYIYSPFELIEQHETRANRWAIQKLVPPDELDGVLCRGLTDNWELADYFEVPEDFMAKAIDYYKMVSGV